MQQQQMEKDLAVREAILEVKRIVSDANNKAEKSQNFKEDVKKDSKQEAQSADELKYNRKLQADMLKSIDAIVNRLESIGNSNKTVTIDRKPDGSLVGKVETIS